MPNMTYTEALAYLRERKQVFAPTPPEAWGHHNSIQYNAEDWEDMETFRTALRIVIEGAPSRSVGEIEAKADKLRKKAEHYLKESKLNPAVKETMMQEYRRNSMKLVGLRWTLNKDK